jgi:3-methylcrotonyl-CoA carboxylase alpha subunit
MGVPVHLEIRLVKAMRLSHRGRVREVRVEGASASIDGRGFDLAPPAETATADTSPEQTAVRALVVDGRRFRVASARAGERTYVWCEGRVYEFEAVRGSRPAASAEHGAGLVSPMPGRVRRLLAAEGSSVSRGQVLLVLEAMKMEHAIRAPQDGVLKRICVAEGDLVEAGVELAELA